MTPWQSRSRHGVTLIELLVVLLIVGITASVVHLAWSSPSAPSASADDLNRLIAHARREAIRSGRPQRVSFVLDEDGKLRDSTTPRAGAFARTVTALPDGGLLAADDLRFDRILGTPATPEGVR